MGNKSTFYVYGRDLHSDEWMDQPLLKSSKCLMNKFKHMVYSFALHRRYTSAKALYLYENRTRVAKAEVFTPNIGTHLYMVITFVDVDQLKKYSEAQEQLIDFEMTFMDRVFANRFEDVDIKEVAETLKLDSSANNQLVFKSKKPIGPTNTT